MKKEIKLTVGRLIFILLIILGFNVLSSQAATNYAINASKVAYSDNSNLGVDNVQAALDGTCVKFNNQLKDIRKSMYPVGSIYLTATLSTIDQVKDLLGGEWEVYGKGKTLVGVDGEKDKYSESNKEGGKENVTLSASQIPSIVTKGTTDTETTGSTGSGYSIGYGSAWRNTSTNGNHYHEITDGHGAGAAGWSHGTGNGINGWAGWGTVNIYPINATTWAGDHYHSSLDYYANSISGVAAHTHTIPSLSVTAKYTNTSQESINVQNPYITVYMYKRIK